MRKIEREMLVAIKRGKNWESGNTEVRHYKGTDSATGINTTEVLLHGNTIASHTDGYDWYYNLCGWNTPTTRSRISSIMREFEDPYLCCGVGTKLGQPEVRFLHGDPVRVESSGWFSVKAYQRVEVEQDSDLPSQN